MSQRFFVGREILGQSAVLEGNEAYHLVRVMRAKPGFRCTLFDGTGTEYDAEVTEVSPKAARLRILSSRAVERELSFRVTIAAPLPKGDRERFLVEKLTELGVTTFVPLITARTVVRPTPSGVRRLERDVIEASKQCGRNRLMRITAPTVLQAFLQDYATAEVRWLAHPCQEMRQVAAGGDAGATSETPSGKLRGEGVSAESPAVPSAESAWVAVVGPEGGFAPEELQAAASLGWRFVDLGPRILRVETAAIVLAVKMTSRG
ncbi:RsmE family RNA methyltransferase [Thermopirellula anaerolimosa]